MNMTLTISLFGAFRASGADFVALNVQMGATVADIKSALAVQMALDFPHFDSASALQNAVLADEMRVLNNDEVISSSKNLAVLPPVCGG